LLSFAIVLIISIHIYVIISSMYQSESEFYKILSNSILFQSDTEVQDIKDNILSDIFMAFFRLL